MNMKFGIKTIDDFALQGKTVLCRVDINEPIDTATGQLKDLTRIRACAPTVRELADAGAKVVLLAHQGSDIEYGNFYTTRPHAAVLSRLVGRKVGFIDDVCGPAAREAIGSLENGDILLLDNVRYMSEEQTLFEKELHLSHERQANTLVVSRLAPLGDLYVCDAFAAAHRDQPSLCGFEQVLPSAMGRLFEREYSILSSLMSDPQRPCTFVLGGAKIADAFRMMEKVLESGIADTILTGGLAGNILLSGQGRDIGRASLDFIRDAGYAEYIDTGKRIYEKYGERIKMPLDLAYTEDGRRCEAAPGSLPDDAAASDIGTQTCSLYKNVIMSSGMVFTNGPMGIFEEPLLQQGTRSVWEALARTGGFTVIGGGDSIRAAAMFNVSDDISYICTGGGALVRFISGEELPVIRALRYSAERFK